MKKKFSIFLFAIFRKLFYRIWTMKFFLTFEKIFKNIVFWCPELESAEKSCSLADTISSALGIIPVSAKTIHLLSKLKKFQVNWINSFWVIVSAVSKKMVSRKTSVKIYNHGTYKWYNSRSISDSRTIHCPLFFLVKLVVYVINIKKKKLIFRTISGRIPP